MKITGDLAEILGIHIGDGCISITNSYKEYYLGGDITQERDYHLNWVSELYNKNIMIPLYNKKVEYKNRPKVGIIGFHVFDGKIVNFFLNLGVESGSKINVEVPKLIMEKKSIYKRFLRGLFDTDGCIYFDKNRSSKNPINNQPTIKLSSVSSKLIEQVFSMLVRIGLHPRMRKPYKGKKDKHKLYSILIYQRGDIKYFIKSIGFKNPKHLTKWKVYKKLGFCPPKTTLRERKKILKQ